MLNIDEMVKREGKVVDVIDDGQWYRLDPAASLVGAEHDAAAIRRSIEYAIEQHAAAEATPGGYTVTFPFKPKQRVRVIDTVEVLTVTGLRVDEPGNITIRTCNPNGRVDVYQSEPLEAIPKTALEVLAELRAHTQRYRKSLATGEMKDVILDKITELKKELTDAP